MARVAKDQKARQTCRCRALDLVGTFSAELLKNADTFAGEPRRRLVMTQYFIAIVALLAALPIVPAVAFMTPRRWRPRLAASDVRARVVPFEASVTNGLADELVR